MERIYRARYGRSCASPSRSCATRRGPRRRSTTARARVQAPSRFAARGSLEAWLWRIVVNEARRVAAERHAVPVEPAALAEAAAAPSNGHRDGGELEALVAALPERQRLALFLRYYADLDYEAVAEALGVRPGAVAATLHAAHSSLRRNLLEVER